MQSLSDRRRAERPRERDDRTSVPGASSSVVDLTSPPQQPQGLSRRTESISSGGESDDDVVVVRTVQRQKTAETAAADGEDVVV
eukprot:COSAG03_NODE_9491_length_715_cov_1.237013_2_plen_83_part_01